MGYDILSMNATNLPKVKSVIRNVSMSTAKELLASVMQMETAQEIREFLDTELKSAGVGRLRPVAAPYKLIV